MPSQKSCCFARGEIHPELKQQLFCEGMCSGESARGVVVGRAVSIHHDMRRGAELADHRGHIGQRVHGARRDRIRDIHRTGSIQRGQLSSAVVQVADQRLHPGFA